MATDMGRPYIRAVREHLPRAVHVFDHFHVVKLFNDKLSDFRRELYASLSATAGTSRARPRSESHRA